MNRLHAVGIDPGLVHTGLVRIELDGGRKEVVVRHKVVDGIDVDAIQEWVGEPDLVFVEKYAPRAHYKQDERMVQGERDIVKAVKFAVTMRNTGVKIVVTPDLMKMLEVWKFPTRTNHDDLRSAARICVLGLMKHDVGNMLLSDAVRDLLDDQPWEVRHEA